MYVDFLNIFFLQNKIRRIGNLNDKKQINDRNVVERDNIPIFSASIPCYVHKMLLTTVLYSKMFYVRQINF